MTVSCTIRRAIGHSLYHTKRFKGAFTIKLGKLPKTLLQILIIGTLLVAFLPVTPVSAAPPTVISITIGESITRHDGYQPTDPNTAGSVSPGTVSGSGTITLTNNAGTVLNNVNLTFTVGTTQNWHERASDVATIPATVANGVVNITSMPVGGVLHIDYDLNPSTAVPPITLTTSYSKYSVTDSLGSSTIIHLTANVNGAALPSDVTTINPTINITSADNATNGTVGKPDWVLNSTATSPLTTSTTTINSLVWTPTITKSGTWPTSTIDVTAAVNDVPALNDGSNGVSLLDMANSSITYTVTSNVGSGSGITLTSASANSSQVQSTIDKQFINGNWTFTPKVSIPSGSLEYSLTSVTEWAVDGSNLNNVIPSVGGPITIGASNHDPSDSTWPVTVDSTHPWAGQGTELLKFAYNGIPVGFMKPVITIQNTPGQFGVATGGATSILNNVSLLKKIYIINGYKVEVVKTVTPDAIAGLYHIDIVATNTGTAATPPNVFIYDIVPSAFYTGVGTSPRNITLNGFVSSPSQQGLANGDQAFYWNLGTLAAGAHETVNYDVVGSGIYDVTNLYVVGVDPAQSVNVQTTPILSNGATMVNSNFESLAAFGVLGLFVVGMIGTVRRRF